MTRPLTLRAFQSLDLDWTCLLIVLIAVGVGVVCGVELSF